MDEGQLVDGKCQRRGLRRKMRRLMYPMPVLESSTPMNKDELRHLIARGESENLEFKRSTAPIKRAFETLCAFLNGKSGLSLSGRR